MVYDVAVDIAVLPYVRLYVVTVAGVVSVIITDPE